MKRTRKIVVKDRVFALGDLKRIAAILDRQQALAQKSNHRARTMFSVQFSDNTAIESDSREVVSEDVLRSPGRPVQLRFSFSNYHLERDVYFELSHGGSSYGNICTITGMEEKWVNDVYMSLKEAIDATPPQAFWFRRHKTIGLHCIALGVGALAQLCIDMLFGWVATNSGVGSIIKLPPDSPWRVLIPKILPILYIARWFIRWMLGMLWAFEIRSWLLCLWPNIELDLGSEHLKLEKLQRNRIVGVITLIVVPIVVSIIYDVVTLAI